MPKYTKQQTRLLLAHELKNFDRFLLQVEAEDEELFHRYVYRLLLKIYELNLSGKYLTKMQACRLIPLRHQNVCQRYVEKAEEEGFIRFKPNPKDKRKIDIIPEKQLLDYVEERLEVAGDELRTLLAEAAKDAPFPKDNLPLAKWMAPK